MMEDRLIEKNNCLNDMSADDRGSFDIKENEEEEDFYDWLNSELPVAAETEVYDSLNSELPVAAGTEGSDAFTTPLAQYKPHDDHSGLRQRRIRQRVTVDKVRVGSYLRGRKLQVRPPSTSDEATTANNLRSRFRDDDYLDEVSQMISPPTVIDEARTDCYLNLGTASFVTARPMHTEQRNTPSILSPMNTPHLMDIQEDSSSDKEVHGIRKCCSQKMDFEWIFVITNTVLEFMSAIFTQLSSKQKPQYALFGMLLSYLALLTCIIELIYKDRRHQKIPQRDKSFATLNNIVALACALGQCVVTTINYRFENLIKVTVLPIFLAFGVLFSKIFKYRTRSST